MNVMDQLRKQRREVLRKQGQPVYHMPGKRERTIKAKMKARGGRDYTTADIVHDFHTKGAVLPPLARYERLLDGLMQRIDWRPTAALLSLLRPEHGHADIVARAADKRSARRERRKWLFMGGRAA